MLPKSSAPWFVALALIISVRWVSQAAGLVYSGVRQLIYAALIDLSVFRTVPDRWSLLGCGIILLGGGLGSAPGYYWTRFRAQLRRHLWGPNSGRLPVKRAALGDAAGVIGAALSTASQTKAPRANA